MSNVLFVYNVNGEKRHMICPREMAEFMASNATNGLMKLTECKICSRSRVSLEELPEEVQEEVKSTLNAFNQANVVYEYGRYHVTAGFGIKHFYAPDHFVCGTYTK